MLINHQFRIRKEDILHVAPCYVQLEAHVSFSLLLVAHHFSALFLTYSNVSNHHETPEQVVNMGSINNGSINPCDPWNIKE